MQCRIIPQSGRWQVRPTDGAKGATNGKKGKREYVRITEEQCFIQSRLWRQVRETKWAFFLFCFFKIKVKRNRVKNLKCSVSMMKDRWYWVLNGSDVNVRLVRVLHFTVGWPIADKWGQSRGQPEVRFGDTPFMFCTPPSLSPSLSVSWAASLLNGHFTSVCYSSG